MSNIFTVKCDLCGNVQTSEDPLKITGTQIVMNGVSKHACAECMLVLDAAFKVGREALKDPLAALAKVEKERDELRRKIEFAGQVKSGNVLTLEEIAKQNRNHVLTNPYGDGRRLGLGLQDSPAVPTHRIEDGKSKNKKKTRR